MKQEYKDKLIELRAKLDRTPEEEVLMKAIEALEVEEKAQPFDKVAVEAAKKAVEDAEEVE